MQWQPALIMILLILTAIFSAGLAMYIGNRRHAIAGLQTFVFLLISVAIWSMAGAVLALTTPTSNAIWLRIMVIGATATPSLWLIFVLEYGILQRSLRKRFKALLSIEPITATLLLWIMQEDFVTINETAFSLSPYAKIHVIYTLGIGLFSAIILTRMLNEGTSHFSRQIVTLLLVCLVPLGSGLLSIWLSSPRSILIPPVTLLFSIIVLGWSLFQYHLLDLVPIARNTVIEQLDNGIITLDAFGRIADLNPAAEHILGRARDEVLGMAAGKAFSTSPGIQKSYNTMTAHRQEIVVDTPSGLKTYQMKISALLDKRKQQYGQIIVLHDISEQKETHAILMQARDNAEKANRIKNEFLANMSHELRTPLNSIIGYTDLTLLSIYGELNEKQRDRLESVSYNAKHLQEMIESILDVSRIESDELTLNLEQVLVKELLEECVINITPRVEEAEITLLENIPEDLPPFTGDAKRIKQIVSSLLSNAVKFTPQGTVALHVFMAQREQLLGLPIVFPQIVDQWVLIAVEDTGIGIADKDQNTLLEDFRQIDGSSTRKFGGTGVGLTLARRLITMMDGKFWLESQQNKGTTIFVFLPIVKSRAAHGENQSADHPFPNPRFDHLNEKSSI